MTQVQAAPELKSRPKGWICSGCDKGCEIRCQPERVQGMVKTDLYCAWCDFQVYRPRTAADREVEK
jgi:hypothetical protein